MSEQDTNLPYDDRSYMAGYNKGLAAGRKLENEECADMLDGEAEIYHECEDDLFRARIIWDQAKLIRQRQAKE